MCVVCLAAGLAVSISPMSSESERREKEELIQTMLAEQEQFDLELMSIITREDEVK